MPPPFPCHAADLDNDHALAICTAGAVKPIATLLGAHSPRVHTRAAAAAAALAESAHCVRLLLAHGCLTPLLSLSQHGTDEARRQALTALRILSLDRDARMAISRAAGTSKLLAGLSRYGSAGVRATATELAASLDTTTHVAVDARAHAREARSTRVAQSRLWHGARPVRVSTPAAVVWAAPAGAAADAVDGAGEETT